MKMFKVLMVALASVAVSNAAIATEKNKTEKSIIITSQANVDRFCMTNECVQVRLLSSSVFGATFQVTYLVDDDNPGICPADKECDDD